MIKNYFLSLVILTSFSSYTQIIGNNDIVLSVNGAIGSPNACNVLNDNGNGPDTLNGNPASISFVNLNSISGATTAFGIPPYLEVATGNVVVPVGTRAFTYEIVYGICEIANPTNCDAARITIIVVPSPINAVDDHFSSSTIDSSTGGTTVSVLTNDELNGLPAIPLYINLTPVSFPSGFTLNPNGTITVAPGVAPSGYTLVYQICEVLNPDNCRSATASLLVTNSLLAPIGSTLQSLPTGSTIANLEVNGENILWYANNYSGKTQQFSDMPLSTTTVLVDGATYYASQTLGGIESTNRLPVTVLLTPLSAYELTFLNFNYSPNPVKHSLLISNSSTIDEILISSILGQKMVVEKVNNLQTEINLNELSNGIYFVRVRSAGQEKTLKIIKE